MKFDNKIMTFLRDEDRFRLKVQQKKERDKQIRDRIKAVLLYDKSWSITAIAEALLLSDAAIQAHITEYHTNLKS